MSTAPNIQVRIGTLVAALAVAFSVLVPADRADALGNLTVSFLDVGQADATLLHHEAGTVLVDTGHWQRSDVVPYLQAAGVDEIDLLIVTHPHADHIGQFAEVIETFNVTKVWWSGSETDSQTFATASAALEASDAAYLEPRSGHSRTVGDLEIDVVNPPAGVGLTDLHDAALAMRITFGDTRWLFTGDAEGSTEARMVQQSSALLDVDVYQVGHHGSSTSTTATFLDAVDPIVAVYSASEGNQYGHPHDEVLDRLDAAGVTTFGTDTHGTVTATTDGTVITMTPESGSAFSFAVDGSDPGDTSPFTDIAGTTHEQAILAIVQAEIITGFPDGTYRPGGDVTRGQMATFLTRALNLPPWEPPDDSDGPVTCVDLNSADDQLLQQIVHIGPERAQAIIGGRPWNSVSELDRIDGIGPARLQDILDEGIASIGCATAPGGGDGLPFTDVAGTTHEQAILAIVQAEITTGFPDGTYRPGGDVTRGQMAAFLTRALNLPPGTTTFPDTKGTTHEAAIAAVADAGIAGGFPDGTYRPGADVTRGQMATFLARALELM